MMNMVIGYVVVSTRSGLCVPHPADGNARIGQVMDVIVCDRSLCGQTTPYTYGAIELLTDSSDRAIIYRITECNLCGIL